MTRSQLEAVFGNNYESIVQMELLLEQIDTWSNSGLDASIINVDTTDFNGILSSSENTVQLALDFIDDITTTDLPEGSNLYFTDERVDDRVANLIQDSSSISWSYDDGAGALTGSVIASGVDHGGLGGLLDDDHTQYSLVDGTRPFTGAVSVHGSSDTSQFIIKGHSTQTANLQEWQDNTGTTVASVAVNGDITTTTGSFIAPTGGIQVDGNGGTYDFTGSFHAGSAKFQFTNNGVLAWWKSQGGYLVKFNNYAPAVTFHSAIAFNVTGNPQTRVLNNEVYLRAPATDTLAMYNGTTAQAFHIYNTYTDASNYERALFDWQTTANTLRIGTEALGTGTVRPIEIQGAGTTILGDASTDVPLTVKGASGQTANLLELKDSTLKNRLTVSADGNLITLGRTDYQAWQGLHDTCTITTGVGGGNSTTACDLVIRPASDSLLADTYIYAGYRISNGGGSGNITIGQEDFVGNASPAGMGTVTIRTGSMATQSGGSFDGGTLAITTGGGGGFGSIGTPAGAGGAINVTLGNGKDTAVASVIAGAGGSFSLTAGNGGVASGTTSTGGDGGSIVLTAGAKGTGTDTDGVDGQIQLNAVQDNAKLSATPSGSVGLAIATVDYVNTAVATVYEAVATSTTIIMLSGKVVEQTASGITTSLWTTPTAGHTITILNRSGGQTTISGNGKNIEGSATFVMNDNESFTFIYNGTQWRVHD